MKPMNMTPANTMMQTVKLPARRRGFTLIELLIVIAIIGILASLTVAGLGAVKRVQALSTARKELEQIKTALENYQQKYGVYPPGNQNANGLYTPKNQDRAQFNQLYYELAGTTSEGPNFVVLGGSANVEGSFIPAASVMVAYGVGGFINCTKGSGEEGKPAQNFLPSLSTKQYSDHVTNNNINTTILVTAANSDAGYLPLGPDSGGLNPVRYMYPGTNNPTGYDLWIQLVIKGKTNLICNWSKTPLINTPYP